MAAVPAVMMVISFAVMVAGGIRVEFQIIVQIIANSLIGAARNTSDKSDAGFAQSVLGAASDASADQDVYASFLEEACQSSVTAATCADHLFAFYVLVFDVIDLETLGVAKMLEDLTIFISNGDFHFITLLLSYGLFRERKTDRRSPEAVHLTYNAITLEEICQYDRKKQQLQIIFSDLVRRKDTDIFPKMKNICKKGRTVAKVFWTFLVHFFEMPLTYGKKGVLWTYKVRI